MPQNSHGLASPPLGEPSGLAHIVARRIPAPTLPASVKYGHRNATATTTSRSRSSLLLGTYVSAPATTANFVIADMALTTQLSVPVPVLGVRLAVNECVIGGEGLPTTVFTKAGLGKMLVQPGMGSPVPSLVALIPRCRLDAKMMSAQEPGRRVHCCLPAAALAQLHEQSGHLRPVSSTRSPRISATRMNTETLARQDSLLRPTCPQVNRVSGAFTAILRLLPSVMTGTSSTVVGQRPGTRPPPVPGLIHHGCHPGLKNTTRWPAASSSAGTAPAPSAEPPPQTRRSPEPAPPRRPRRLPRPGWRTATSSRTSRRRRRSPAPGRQRKSCTRSTTVPAQEAATSRW